MFAISFIIMIISGFYMFNMLKYELKKIKEYKTEIPTKGANKKVVEERTKKDRLMIVLFTFSSLFFIILAFSDSNKKENTAGKKDTKVVVKKEEKKQEVKKELSEEEKKKIEEEKEKDLKIKKEKILKEKERILKMLENAKNNTLNSWNSTIEALNNGNFETAYNRSKKYSKQLENIIDKLNNYECEVTRYDMFDMDCEALLKKAIEAYTMKDETYIAIQNMMNDGLSEQGLQTIKTNFDFANEEWKILQSQISNMKEKNYIK